MAAIRLLNGQLSLRSAQSGIMNRTNAMVPGKGRCLGEFPFQQDKECECRIFECAGKPRS